MRNIHKISLRFCFNAYYTQKVLATMIQNLEHVLKLEILKYKLPHLNRLLHKVYEIKNREILHLKNIAV